MAITNFRLDRESSWEWQSGQYVVGDMYVRVYRGVVPGGAPPYFGRSVNPISTRGDRLCPPNYYWHPRIFRPSDGPESRRTWICMIRNVLIIIWLHGTLFPINSVGVTLRLKYHVIIFLNKEKFVDTQCSLSQLGWAKAKSELRSKEWQYVVALAYSIALSSVCFSLACYIFIHWQLTRSYWV